MKTSNYYFPTLKESPAEANLISHKLMLRAGLIRKLASGLYSWLPLGLKILRKVEEIIRDEMNKAGCLELLMPIVQPSELWQESERWDAYGSLLLKMTDRHGRDFCFAPTHEEVITDLIRHEIKSYKQLPKNFYQIQTKFRDEIRPRFGVMRAREFLMKDAYSFHLSEDCLKKTYEKMFQAYTNIFMRLGLNFRAVFADTGEIGGHVSHEFHVLAESGEDEIIFAPEGTYAANVELATSLGPASSYAKNALDIHAQIIQDENEKEKELQLVSTPNITSVPEQAKYMGIAEKQIIKTLLVKGGTDKHPVVALLIRGDMEFNHFKVEKCKLVASPLTLVDPKTVQDIAKCNPGFVGPKDLSVPVIADNLVMKMKNFSHGANQNDKHYINANWGRDLKKPDLIVDLIKAQKGDISPDYKGTLDVVRGIEVGHIFQLGDKYTQSMNTTILDENGKSKHPIMGCYGIGVSRIIAAAIEQNHDDKGIIWTEALAPFKVVIVPVDFHKVKEVKKEALALYEKLKDFGIDVLLDDRKERPGVMFKDMELIGIPHRVVISAKTLSEEGYAKFDYKGRRDSDSVLVTLEELVKKIKSN